MKRKILWSLAALNALLLVGLFASRMRDNAAVAQIQRPIDFIMVPGEITGGATGVVYIIDTTTGQLGAFAYEESNNQLNIMPPVNLARALESPRAGTGTNTGAGNRNRNQ
jgi:hypothetical protein